MHPGRNHERTTQQESIFFHSNFSTRSTTVSGISLWLTLWYSGTNKYMFSGWLFISWKYQAFYSKLSLWSWVWEFIRDTYNQKYTGGWLTRHHTYSLDHTVPWVGWHRLCRLLLLTMTIIFHVIFLVCMYTKQRSNTRGSDIQQGICVTDLLQVSTDYKVCTICLKLRLQTRCQTNGHN